MDGSDRWQFEKLLPYVVGALEKMHLNKKNVYNREPSAKAGSHFYLCTSFKIIAALVIGRRVLDYFDQNHNTTSETCKRHFMCLKDTIRIIVNNMDEYHNKWYAEILALAENLHVKESMPRGPKKTMHRDNPPSNKATEYYKRSISIPLVNHLQTQLND